MSSISSENDNAGIGRRLFSVRARASLSQTAFAEALGVSPRAYQNYERGEREIPALLIRSLYLQYAIDPIWLLTGEGQNQPPSPLDMKRLQIVLEELEQRLDQLKARLVPAKKAELVMLVYNHAGTQPNPDTEFMDKLVSLVA